MGGQWLLARPFCLALGLAAAALVGCAPVSEAIRSLPVKQAPDPEPEKLDLTQMEFPDLPGWAGDNHAEALSAFIRSCDKLELLPKEKPLGARPEMGLVADWLEPCQTARKIRPGNKIEAQYFFESRFAPYNVRSAQFADGLFTGYYEPDLNGAFGPDQRYRYPLYRLPDDIITANLSQFDQKLGSRKLTGRLEKGKFVPYYSRAQIEDGALKGRQLETIWVDNAIDAFILHVQGSGRVLLSDGSFVRVGYAGRNGHAYTSIGRELVNAQAMRLEDVTMPAIRAWMEANPAAGRELMRKNKSFIFFKVKDGPGPVGAQGIVLTPGRSLAVDRDFYPLGVPMWLTTTDPGVSGSNALRRLMVAQDTGGAIKGQMRGDFFWGNGPVAATKAGLMKEEGRFYLLLPRTAAPGYQKRASRR